MKAFHGFGPAAVVIIPLAVAAIRDVLFSTGDMDSYGYMLVAMLGFMVGGILNFVYLGNVLRDRSAYFSFAQRWQVITAKAGFLLALLVLVLQAAFVLAIVWKQMTMK